VSRAARNAATFARAQAAYDAMTPPEDGPVECPECEGSGVNKLVIGDRCDHCECCGGTGWLDENGEPFDPAQAERDRDEYADYQRGDI
jgi:DnaJ-class molecular chaperone